MDQERKLILQAISRRKWYLNHDLCPECGAERDDERYLRCAICRNAPAEYKRNEIFINLLEAHRYFQRRYNERKLAGRCTTCGIRPASDGFLKCKVCRAKVNKRQLQRYYDNKPKKDRSICYRVGCGLPVVEGYRCCEKHVKELQDRMFKARLSKKVKGKK